MGALRGGHRDEGSADRRHRTQPVVEWRQRTREDSRPPGRRTRAASRAAVARSETRHRTVTAVTTSNASSGNGTHSIRPSTKRGRSSSCGVQSRDRGVQRRAIDVDADGPRPMRREGCGEQAIATSEVEHSLAIDRSHEGEDAALLERFRHCAQRRGAPPRVDARPCGSGQRRLERRRLDVARHVWHYSNIHLSI